MRSNLVCHPLPESLGIGLVSFKIFFFIFFSFFLMHLHFHPLRGHFDPPRQGPMVDPMTHHPKPLPLVLLHQARLIFALPTEFFQEKQKKLENGQNGYFGPFWPTLSRGCSLLALPRGQLSLVPTHTPAGPCLGFWKRRSYDQGQIWYTSIWQTASLDPKFL